jgi:hypothetical protein
MSNLNFDFVKNDLLSQSNLETLIIAVDFYISLEPKNIESAISVVKKLKHKEINFNSDDANAIITALLNFKNFLLEDLIVEPNDPVFISDNKMRIPIINNILSLMKTALLSNGFNFKI